MGEVESPDTGINPFHLRAEDFAPLGVVQCYRSSGRFRAPWSSPPGEHRRGEQTRGGSDRAAEKTNLARGEVGIAERKPAPILKDYVKVFERDVETLKSDRPATVKFYKEKLRLLAFEPLANCRLDRIDEALISRYSEMRSRQALVTAALLRRLQ